MEYSEKVGHTRGSRTWIVGGKPGRIWVKSLALF